MSSEPVLYQRTSKPSRDSGKRGWIFWLLVIGLPMCVLVYIAMIVGFGYFYATNVKELPVGEAEWKVVVDARDVAEWLPDLRVEGSDEALSKIRYIDRSYEVSYEFDPPDTAIYVSSSLSVERKVTDAISSYLPLWTATIAGFKIGGHDNIEVKALDDFFEWGDQSKVGLISADGEPYGNLFVAREGNNVVYLLLFGIYFDEPDTWTEFISPTLAEIDRYRPE